MKTDPNLTKIKKEIISIINNNLKQNSQTATTYILTHLENVEKIARKLCKLYPKANLDVVLLAVWLHDIGRVFGHEKDHDRFGADYALSYLSKKGFDEKSYQQVSDVCLSHGCDDILPKSLEAKILASSDAISHFLDDCLIRYIHMRASTDYLELKQKLLNKIDKDFNNKIYFPEAKEWIRHKYEAWKIVFTDLDI